MSKKWQIPVTWEMCGVVSIEADTLEEAIDRANNDDSIPLPLGSYVDSSFEVSFDDPDCIRELYNNNQPDQAVLKNGNSNQIVNISDILNLVNPNRFTSTTSAILCSDYINDRKIVCVDLCYDASDALPTCDVVNLIEMPYSDEAIRIGGLLLNQLSEMYQIPVSSEISDQNEIFEQHKSFEHATFVSVWDGDIFIETDCKVNRVTGEVFDIEVANGVAEFVNNLEREFIRFTDGTEFVVSQEKNNEGFWYGDEAANTFCDSSNKTKSSLFDQLHAISARTAKSLPHPHENVKASELEK